jgi:hypothetical protein
MWLRMQAFDITFRAYRFLFEQTPDRLATQTLSFFCVQRLPDFCQTLAYPPITFLWVTCKLILYNFG